MNKEFSRLTSSIPALFAALRSSAPFSDKGVASQKGKNGVYVFFEDDIPVHVGRTRNLQRRLRDHITRSHYSASFAFKRARRTLNMQRTYRPEGSRAALTRHKTFGPEFDRQIARVKKMQIRFLEINNPLQQYLLELYAAMEWGLPLDEFDTH